MLSLLFLLLKDGFWSGWYGSGSGTTYTIESSLDDDSFKKICVGWGNSNVPYLMAIKATFVSGSVSGWFGGRYNTLYFVSWRLVCYLNILRHFSYDEKACFTLSTDEYISSVLVRAGSFIDALTFTSSLSTEYGRYGGDGGTAYTVTGGSDYAVKKMQVVAETKWRNVYITRIRFYFDKGKNTMLSLTETASDSFETATTYSVKIKAPKCWEVSLIAYFGMLNVVTNTDMTIIDGVWNDDFQFDTNGKTGWYLFKQDDGELSATNFTGSSGIEYYGPMVGDSSGEGRHLVKFLFINISMRTFPCHAFLCTLYHCPSISDCAKVQCDFANNSLMSFLQKIR